jgi:hypothetical protein
VQSSLPVEQFLVICLTVSRLSYGSLNQIFCKFHLKFHPGNATALSFFKVNINSNNKYQSKDGSAFNSIFLVVSSLCCDSL